MRRLKAKSQLAAILASTILALTLSGAAPQPVVAGAISRAGVDTVRLDVPLIAQNPELPNGCEITSLAMVLNSLGYEADKTVLSEQYLPRGTKTNDGQWDWASDPAVVYVGDPADTSGWYCWAPPLVQAANGFIEATDGAYAAHDITGTGAEELEAYIENGVPVIVWLTVDGHTPRRSTARWRLENGNWYIPYSNSHCAVLNGMDGENYLFSDPLEAIGSMAKKHFAKVYTQMGSRAVVLLPNE